MPDVMCPLRFEDFDALMADDEVPLELAALFEGSARTVELIGSYEMELTEAEARALLAYATEPRDAPLGAGSSAGVGRLRATEEGERSEAVIHCTPPPTS